MAESLGVIHDISEIREDGKDGYVVRMSHHHTIKILIANRQECCETWGYMSSEDNLDSYVGAELQEIRLTDTALNQAVIDSLFPCPEGLGIHLGIQFVDFVTDQGTFQLAVYNYRDGSYSHDIRIIQDDEVLLDDTL